MCCWLLLGADGENRQKKKRIISAQQRQKKNYRNERGMREDIAYPLDGATPMMRVWVVVVVTCSAMSGYILHLHTYRSMSTTNKPKKKFNVSQLCTSSSKSKIHPHRLISHAILLSIYPKVF
jgi:hypothetical protein